MKLIAVTQRVDIYKNIQERRDAVSQEWTMLADACGFIPVFLPNNLQMSKIILENMDISGILLTGGNTPIIYGGDAPERDELEKYLIDYAIDKDIPLLGVCRGMHMLLGHFGTKLERVEGHVRTFHQLSNKDEVNSFHSWGTKNCELPLIAEVKACDDIVEAVSHNEYYNIHGIMWHPERYNPFRKKDIEMIRSIFKV